MATEPAPCDLDVYLNAWELRDGTIKHEFNVAAGAIAATTTVSVGRGITLGGCTSYDATRVFPSSVKILKIRYTISIVAQIENTNSLAITELFPNIPIQFSEIFVEEPNGRPFCRRLEWRMAADEEQLVLPPEALDTTVRRDTRAFSPAIKSKRATGLPLGTLFSSLPTERPCWTHAGDATSKIASLIL
ncbi:hypothetical protein HZH68_008955 [Vespula germanica]|uniref:Uncharacterized protein n=1 Tax=Vespula germanica TaxID=30212 RepID=A0A834JZX7_VESGE|nr:hypothetical protein HZH68_008955 [Vespula germanica]